MKTSLPLALLASSLLGFSPLRAEVEPLRVLPLGDSLTAGYTVPVHMSGYRDVLQAMLVDAGYNIDFLGSQYEQFNSLIPDPHHEGHSGWRIDEIHTHIGGWLNAIQTPDVILLLIGTNDIHQSYQVATAPQRLENLVASIATARPQSKILLANLLIRTDDAAKNAQHSHFNTFVPGIVAHQVSLGRQVYFVDLHSLVTPAGMSSDGLHPNQIGYDDMAAGWFDRIVTLVSPSSVPPTIESVTVHDFTHVAVTFSKPVSDDAAAPVHFHLSGGIAIHAAALEPNFKRTVILTTATLAQNTEYLLTVNGIVDRTPDAHPLAPNSTALFATETIANGGFETVFSAWNFLGNANVANFAPYLTTEGSHVAVFNWGNSTPNGVVSQTFTTIPGHWYTLQFDAGVYSAVSKPQHLHVSLTGSAPLLAHTMAIAGQKGGVTIWSPATFTFAADSTSTLLQFHDVSSTTGSIDLLLDNVRVTPRPTHTLSVASAPISAVNITATPADIHGQTGGTTNFSRTYDQGINVTLTAPPSVSGAPFLKWQRGGIDFSTNTSVSVALDDDESLLAVYSANAPLISAQPQDLTATIGGIAQFSVTAGGAGPLSYAWYFNGVPIAGAQSSTYSIANTQPAHAGVYSVAVSNPGGTTVSQDATLAVIGGGTIANASFENDFSTWSAFGNVNPANFAPYESTDGSTAAVFNWGESAPNGTLIQRFTTTPGLTYSLRFDVGAFGYNTKVQRLTVTVLGSAPLLTHTVSVFSPGGGNTRWSTAELSFTADTAITEIAFQDTSPTTQSIDLLLDNVRISPDDTRTLSVASSPIAVSITISPSDQNGASSGTTPLSRTYDEGAMVDLSAPSSAPGHLFQKWQRNGVDFSSSSSISLTLNSDESLTAIYTSTAPVITAQPDDVTVALGEPASFSVTATASSMLSYQWKHDGEDIPGATTSTYPISSAGADDAGLYTVVVTSAGQSVTSSSAALTVLLPPEPFTNGSFEESYAGWTASGNQAIANFEPYSSTHGSHVAVFNWGQSAPNGILSQTFETVPGQNYQLQFDLGAFGYNKNTQRLRVVVVGHATQIDQTISIVGLGGGATRWQTHAIEFIADGTSSTITFSDVSTTSNNIDMLLDHVRISP